MKTYIIKFALGLLVVLNLNSCGNDDDNSTPLPINKFTVQGTDYETPKAYLVFDDSTPYGDAFFLNLLDSDMREDSVNGMSVSSNLTQGIVLLVEHGPVAVLTEQDVNIASNTTYQLDKENSLALTNVTGFNDTYIYNGITYGEPDQTTANVYKIENSGNGTVTINSITIDYVARTGTIDCTYQLTDDNGIIIAGNYSGNFNILNGF